MCPEWNAEVLPWQEAITGVPNFLFLLSDQTPYIVKNMYVYVYIYTHKHISVLTAYRGSTPKRNERSNITSRRGYRDPEGGSPRVRPFHCTTVGLTPAIAPNVGKSGAR